ncbi:hypothetical protein ACET9K_13720 [Aeromonas enteropelogenes]
MSKIASRAERCAFYGWQANTIYPDGVGALWHTLCHTGALPGVSPRK